MSDIRRKLTELWDLAERKLQKDNKCTRIQQLAYRSKRMKECTMAKAEKSSKNDLEIIQTR